MFRTFRRASMIRRISEWRSRAFSNSRRSPMVAATSRAKVIARSRRSSSTSRSEK